jgi:hypothetical protein
MVLSTLALVVKCDALLPVLTIPSFTFIMPRSIGYGGFGNKETQVYGTLNFRALNLGKSRAHLTLFSRWEVSQPTRRFGILWLPTTSICATNTRPRPRNAWVIKEWIVQIECSALRDCQKGTAWSTWCFCCSLVLEDDSIQLFCQLLSSWQPCINDRSHAAYYLIIWLRSHPWSTLWWCNA